MLFQSREKPLILCLVCVWIEHVISETFNGKAFPFPTNSLLFNVTSKFKKLFKVLQISLIKLKRREKHQWKLLKNCVLLWKEFIVIIVKANSIYVESFHISHPSEYWLQKYISKVWLYRKIYGNRNKATFKEEIK